MEQVDCSRCRRSEDESSAFGWTVRNLVRLWSFCLEKVFATRTLSLDDMDYALERVDCSTLNCRLIMRLGGWKVAGVVEVVAEEVGKP